MISFDRLYQTAILHKSGEQAVNQNLPQVKNADQLAKTADAHYLSTLCRRVFRAGLKHSMVDARWPSFEEAFYGFDPVRCAMLSDEALDERMKNTALIRHFRKMKSIRDNAGFILRTSEQHGGFGRWLADWPQHDVVGLWQQLKKQGCQLGGMSGPYFLRMAGKDTFLLTRDVTAVLITHGAISRAPTSVRDQRLVEAVFLEWQQQCGRPLAEISRIVSYTAG